MINNVLVLKCELPKDVVSMNDRDKCKVIEVIFNSFGERNMITDFRYDEIKETIIFSLASGAYVNAFSRNLTNIFNNKFVSARRSYNVFKGGAMSSLDIILNYTSNKVMMSTFDKLLPFVKESLNFEMDGFILGSEGNYTINVKTVYDPDNKIVTSEVIEADNLKNIKSLIYTDRFMTNDDLFLEIRDNIANKFNEAMNAKTSYSIKFDPIDPTLLMNNMSLCLLADKVDNRRDNTINNYVFYYIRNTFERFVSKKLNEIFDYVAISYSDILDNLFMDVLDIYNTNVLNTKCFNSKYRSHTNTTNALIKLEVAIKKYREDINKDEMCIDLILRHLREVNTGLNNIRTARVEISMKDDDMISYMNGVTYNTPSKNVSHMEAQRNALFNFIECETWKVITNILKLEELIFN